MAWPDIEVIVLLSAASRPVLPKLGFSFSTGGTSFEVTTESFFVWLLVNASCCEGRGLEERFRGERDRLPAPLG